MSKRHGPVGQELLLFGLGGPGDFTDHVHDDFAGGAGADVDGSKVHLQDEFAAGLDGEPFVDLFLRLGVSGETSDEQKNGR